MPREIDEQTKNCTRKHSNTHIRSLNHLHVESKLHERYYARTKKYGSKYGLENVVNWKENVEAIPLVLSFYSNYNFSDQ